MSRRPANCFRSLLTASLAALALTGCSGGGQQAPAPPPIAATKPVEEPTPTPPPKPQTPTPAEAAPVAPPTGEVASEPRSMPRASSPAANPPPPGPDQKATPAEKPVDALQWLQESEARRADYQRRVAEAEAKVASANEPVAAWERNILAFKNPFLKRPQLSPEDSQAIAGMDGVARVQWAEGRLAETRAARDAAQKTLDDLKANPPPN